MTRLPDAYGGWEMIWAGTFTWCLHMSRTASLMRGYLATFPLQCLWRLDLLQTMHSRQLHEALHASWGLRPECVRWLGPAMLANCACVGAAALMAHAGNYSRLPLDRVSLFWMRATGARVMAACAVLYAQMGVWPLMLMHNYEPHTLVFVSFFGLLLVPLQLSAWLFLFNRVAGLLTLSNWAFQLFALYISQQMYEHQQHMQQQYIARARVEPMVYSMRR